MKLYHGDCLEVMDRLIADGVKVDLILTDPPYGTTACKWDSIIPLDEMWKRLDLLRKERTPIVFFASQPFTSKLVMSNIDEYKHHWIWQKNRGTGFQVAKHRPMMATEDIIMFANKGKRANYYPQMVKLEKAVTYTSATSSNGTNPLKYFGNDKKVVNEKYPTNTLSFSKVSKVVHPTQKPTDLLDYLIKTYSKEGDIVLDFTMGSGSTGVACVNTNRDFIGIELDENYFNIAKKRIEDASHKLL
jgi:DNA modification methylase